MPPPSQPPQLHTFTNPPPRLSPSTLLTFPTPRIALVTLNRPSALNSIPIPQHHELARIFTWLDAEPSLRCGIIAGAPGSSSSSSPRAFCAGADLKEWNDNTQSQSQSSAENNQQRKQRNKREMPPTGFGGLSRRNRGKKPIIAAVDGLCLGGGMEMAVNCDMVIAGRGAVFGLPEVKVGVVALAGALPRVVRTVGRQRAMELVLTGRQLGAEEAREWGLVNEVVDDKVEGGVVKRAVEVAEVICGNSPDSVVVSKMGVEMGWEGIGVEEATEKVLSEGWARMEGGENMREGVRAFVEKRKARWRDSKL
ncbi:MAG: hypothetical protein Q9208_007271 [Pyrenodesmia sp. 3 TL-2023]